MKCKMLLTIFYKINIQVNSQMLKVVSREYVNKLVYILLQNTFNLYHILTNTCILMFVYCVSSLAGSASESGMVLCITDSAFSESHLLAS